MSVRPATSGDLAVLQTLEERLFGVDAWSAASLTEEVTAGHVRVLDVDGRVVGYLATRTVGDGVDLTRIGVDPERRRDGVATRLLAEVPTGQPVLLEVSETNSGALAFYTAAGFVEIDRRRRYYRDGTDAVVMRRAAQ